jgi:eukaryotic-like serine/threonine-protein kinase
MSRSGEQWHRVRQIFDRVAELDPRDRERAVEELAGADADVRHEVLDLLAALEREGGRLDRVRAVDVVGADEVEPPGLRLGPYRLLRAVGEGGMGCVYEAVRDDDQFRKRVAIKLIRRDMATEGLIRRFRQERQILAGLDHPNIARLLDGGTTEDGRPYLVMEFVDGEPITEYSRRTELSLRDRLRLFVDVCEAVHHAHRHLVVHRDLKPGNILVSPAGVVKLLDFGVAKLLPDPVAASRSQVTATAYRPFTPAYASPEQVKGGAITTATDVYSLGVILYELLTERHPFDAVRDSPLELAQRLETEPVRPSVAVTARPGRPADPAAARLRRTLAGELDNIVLKAMRPEPTRRYGSAQQLAEDIHRFLAGLPVLAQRDTIRYRLRKFAWRHRTGVVAAGLVLATLVGGVVATSYQARRAAEERDRARTEARRAERLSSFLTGMLRSPDPWVEGRDLLVSELLAGAAARSADEFADDPELLAEIQTAIGMSYAGLGSLAESDALLASALRIRRSLPEPNPSGIRASLANYAGLLLYRGDPAGAEPLLQEALAMPHGTTRQDSIGLADLKSKMGSLLQARGDWEAAGREQEEALAMRRRLLGDQHADVAESINDLAVVRGQQGDFVAAEALLREAIGIQTRARGPDHPDVAAGLTNLAFAVTEQGRFQTADSLYLAALGLRLRALGDEHPDVAWTRYAYATMLQQAGDYSRAETHARQVLALRHRTLPDEHPLVAASLQVLGQALAARDRDAEAEDLFRESLDIRRASLPPGHWLIAAAESVLGECLSRQGLADEAESRLMTGYQGLRDAMGPDNPRTREAARRLRDHYIQRGDSARAAAYPDL